MTLRRLLKVRSIVAQMPHNEATRLRQLLTLPCGSRRRTQLIARQGLSLDSLIVAHTYTQAVRELRKAEKSGRPRFEQSEATA